MFDQKTGNSFKLWVYPYPMHDYFEIDRLIEDLAKIYSTACATTCFNLSKTELPTRAEFQGPEIDKFRDYARGIPRKEIEKVLQGENKAVERRYKYYVEYN